MTILTRAGSKAPHLLGCRDGCTRQDVDEVHIRLRSLPTRLPTGPLGLPVLVAARARLCSVPARICGPVLGLAEQTRSSSPTLPHQPIPTSL